MNKNELGFKEIFEKENGSHSLTIAPRQTLLPTQTIVILEYSHQNQENEFEQNGYYNQKENARTTSGTNSVGKEKNGFHSLTIAPEQDLVSSRTEYIKQNLYKYLSVEEISTKMGWQSLANAPDLISGVLHEHVGSNSLISEMEFQPPASIDNSTRHNGCGIKFEKIASIKQLGPQHVYDLRIGFIEKLGTGFDRMKNFCKKSNSPDFNLDVDQKYFRIEFFKSGDYLRLAEQAKAVEKTVEKILAIIKEKPRITQKELSEETGLSRRGIEWNLQKLRNEGIIKRIGPDKGGYWEIIK